MRTRVVRGAAPEGYAHSALTPAIVQTASYVFRDTAELVAFFEGRGGPSQEYGRYGNPTVRLLEQRVAELEGAGDGLAFASGMAALTTSILALTRSGSHVVLFADCYRRTRHFVRDFLARFGVEHTLLAPGDVSGLEAALRPETRLVISEAPTNPFQIVVDLERMSAICREHRVKTLVDSTFATPINLRPMELGVDLVVHSATKYLAGHHDVLGGVLLGKPGLVSLVRELHHEMGAVMDPHAAFLSLRGLKTLALRVEAQNATGLALAQALEGHTRVRRVWYPGLASHPSHGVAARLMEGFGGVVSFELDATLEATGQFIDACELPRIAPSLGGVDSLIEQPARMSYFELDARARRELGIPDGLVRYAVGIEDTQDIVQDTLRALDAV
ncbi:MAG: aminotransferase class I/II-fold pyridoxal phosphate-dependent enzyme [Deltaproteobacteria bacterium]|nr:aminotransferase class I/II-fold pyridoxal phosphate-dependent enzyme [Deltaproteobacteria bacterium]